MDKHNEIYEAALKRPRSFIWRALYAIWLVGGLAGLIYIAWAEPWSGMLFDKLLASGVAPWVISYVGIPLVMALRAVLLVESAGYAYHRFFQHVGFFTRRALVFRKNQRFHWIHHMIIYPIGRFYRRAVEYVSSEKGVGWSWVLPGVLMAAGFILSHGLNLGSVVFLVAFGLYAKFIVDLTHSRFHEVNHPWAESRYFHWLEDIHLLHHWDQRKNFTIVHPLMDYIFGTYLSPKKHREELRIALEDRALTVSDLINWRYLLIEATPAEYAAFVSAARQHPRSVRKLELLLDLLSKRTASHPGDSQAADLRQRASDLLKVVSAMPRSGGWRRSS